MTHLEGVTVEEAAEGLRHLQYLWRRHICELMGIPVGADEKDEAYWGDMGL